MSEKLAIVGATVIDGLGGSPLQDATVLVSNGIIELIASSPVDIPESFRVIDAQGKFLLPGYMNANIHLLDGIMMMGVVVPRRVV